MSFRRPCLDCGKLTDGANRCEVHEAAYRSKRNARLDSLYRRQKKLAKYNSQYKQRAKQVRANAVACHICGRAFVPGDQIEADHLYPELMDASPLAAAHKKCNASRGNKPLNQ